MDVGSADTLTEIPVKAYLKGMPGREFEEATATDTFRRSEDTFEGHVGEVESRRRQPSAL
jgi:hypothetical protein